MRTLFPAFLALAACSPTAFVDVPLTETCAVTYAGGTELNLHAADADASVSLWVQLPDPPVAEAVAGDTVTGAWDFADGVATGMIHTGRNLREPCSDLAMNEVQTGTWTAASGTAELTALLVEDAGIGGATVSVAVRDLVVVEDGGDEVAYGDYDFEGLEVWVY